MRFGLENGGQDSDDSDDQDQQPIVPLDPQPNRSGSLSHLISHSRTRYLPTQKP